MEQRETGHASGTDHAKGRSQQEWRPAGVCKIYARAGGATEATDAGANLSDIRPMMGHTDPKTTTRYMRGNVLEPSRRVATLRVAHRSKNGP